MFTILEAYGALFDRDFFVPLIGRGRALGFIEDFFAVAVLVALCVFTGIRYANSPKRKGRLSRFFGSHTGAAWLVLVMIASVMLTLIGYRAAQVNTGNFPYGNSWWPFASHAVSRLFAHFGAGVNSDLETVLLILNIAVIVGFAVFLSYSKHLHIVLAPINVATSRRPRALGPLYNTPDMDMENVSEDTVFGAGHIEDLSWKQLLDTLTCTECGRCQSVCPAWNTGKPLSPKLLIMGLRDNLFESSPRLVGSPAAIGARDARRRRGSGAAAQKAEAPTLVPGTIDPDVLWSCLTCGACVEECPVDIEHVDTIVEMRRYEVLMESRFPTEAGLMLRNIENQGDPWGLGGAKRTEWTEALDFEIPVITGTIPDDIEYLYWVGCAGALDERARKATQATARLLHRAGVSFGILGPRESCTGDPARRLGNEYLYQEMGKANIATLDEVGAKKVIASCPHCFNSLSREYPDLGGNFEVIHHSQLLSHLVDDGQAHAGDHGRQGHLPRPLLPGPAQPGLRRAPQRPRLHHRRRADRDEAVPGEELLLRRGRGPHVDGGEPRQAGQPRAHRRGPRDRRRRGVDGVSLLPHHARRRRAGPVARGRRQGARPVPGGRGVAAGVRRIGLGAAWAS